MCSLAAMRCPSTWLMATSASVLRSCTSSRSLATTVAVLTGTSTTTPSMPANTSRRTTGSKVPLDCTLKSSRPEDSASHQASTRGGDGHVLGKRAGPTIQRRLAQRPPHGHEKQVLMLQGVGQRRGAVPADHVHPLRHGRRQAAVFDLLDDQRAEGRLRLLALLGIVLVFQPRAPQRQHGHRLRVRLVDVFLHGLFDLRGHVAGCRRCTRSDRRVATTAVASRPSRRMVLERLSNTSWPLTASITHLLPLRMATLTRSHSISRRPSLAIV